MNSPYAIKKDALCVMFVRRDRRGGSDCCLHTSLVSRVILLTADFLLDSFEPDVQD